MRSSALLSTVLVALALIAAGCGGSDDEEQDPTAAWASGFCTAITNWTDELQNITSQLSDTSNLNEEGLQSGADDAKSATDQLIDELQSLGAPETDSGEEVESSLDSLSSTLETEAGKIETAAEGVSGLTDLPGAITTITTALSAMGSAFASTFQTIESADVGDELQTALEDAPECADISS